MLKLITEYLLLRKNVSPFFVVPPCPNIRLVILKRCPVSASPVLQTGIPRIVDCPAIADSSGEGESDVSSNESDGNSHIGVGDAIVAEGDPPPTILTMNRC